MIVVPHRREDSMYLVAARKDLDTLGEKADGAQYHVKLTCCE